jgi:hypothetical protein
MNVWCINTLYSVVQKQKKTVDARKCISEGRYALLLLF